MAVQSKLPHAFEQSHTEKHPTQHSAQYLLIGSGRLARHLQFYFQSLDISLKTWDRAQDPQLLKQHLDICTHILLAISDSALENFHRLHLDGLEKTVVHFSGALAFSEMVGTHPLMTFGTELYAEDFYRQIHFVLDVDKKISEILPGLTNPSSYLAREKKPLYHALCVMGGNFTTLLSQKMIKEFTALGLDPEASHLYMRQIVENVFADPHGALTGPLARRDQASVQRNLDALAQDPYQKIYQAFLQMQWPEFSARKL